MVTQGSGEGTRFFGQTAQTARLMLYGLLAAVLMAMDHRGHYVPRLRAMAGYLVEPVHHVVEWPIRGLRNLYGQFQSRRYLRHENENLRETLLAQRARLQRLETLVEENQRLRALFEGARGQSFAYQYAELLRVDLDPFSHRVIVDRGFVDGVEQGQAVIDGAGVMGQVEEVHPHHSTIRLISDPNHALPVQINRTGLRTVAFGSGETSDLNLPSVPRQADIREGDLIVTSGLGDRFPGGYPVAHVTAVNREAGQTFAHVRARPLAALDRGREVLLIRTAPATVPAELTGKTEARAGDTAGAGGPSDAEPESAGQAQAPLPESASSASSPPPQENW